MYVCMCVVCVRGGGGGGGGGGHGRLVEMVEKANITFYLVQLVAAQENIIVHKSEKRKATTL